MPAETARELRIELLPAGVGDCVALECVEGKAVRRVLIDGGPPDTAAVVEKRFGVNERDFELLVVSHIDSDHIGGVPGILEAGFRFADAWFNGFVHLPGPAQRSVRQGESLSEQLTGKKGGAPLPWNTAFDGGAVLRADDDPKSGRCVEAPPVIRLKWGLELTLLSPTPKRLKALRPGWHAYLQKLRAGKPSSQTPNAAYRRAANSPAAWAARKSRRDAKAPNGSSIAFIAEYAGRSCLFAADAFATVLYPALHWLAEKRGKRLDLDVFKLPHHGAQGNVASELFDVVRARHYLVSTNGEQHGHPDDEAIARVVVFGGPDHQIWFNYDNERTGKWRKQAWIDTHGYTPRYPKGPPGVRLVLPERRAPERERRP